MQTIEDILPIITALIDIDSLDDQMSDALLQQSLQILSLSEESDATNRELHEGVLTLSDALEVQGGLVKKNIKIVGVLLGLGVGAAAGFAAGGVGMFLGAVFGGPMFGYIADLGGRLLNHEVQTKSQKDLLISIEQNWEMWSDGQTCYQCDGSVTKWNKHHCRSCGYIFCSFCVHTGVDIQKDKVDFKNTRVCCFCLENVFPVGPLTEMDDTFLYHCQSTSIFGLSHTWKNCLIGVDSTTNQIQISFSNSRTSINLEEIIKIVDSNLSSDEFDSGVIIQAPHEVFKICFRKYDRTRFMVKVGKLLHIINDTQQEQWSIDEPIHKESCSLVYRGNEHSGYLTFYPTKIIFQSVSVERCYQKFHDLVINGFHTCVQLGYDSGTDTYCAKDNKKLYEILLHMKSHPCFESEKHLKYSNTTVKHDENTHQLEVLENLSEEELISLLDTGMLYKDIDLLKKIIQSLFSREISPETVRIVLVKLLRNNTARILAEKYFLLRQLFSDKGVVEKIRNTQISNESIIDHSDSIADRFSMFRNWFSDLKENSYYFTLQVQQSFPLLERIAILGERKEMGWVPGYLMMHNDFFTFCDENTILKSRRYKWKYRDLECITHHSFCSSTWLFTNGTTFSLFSPHTFSIEQSIVKNSVEFHPSSESSPENSSNPIEIPRNAHYVQGIYDLEYEVMTMTTPDSIEENESTLLDEIHHLVAKLHEIDRLIGTELDDQLSTMETISDLVQTNIEVLTKTTSKIS